MYRNKNRQTKTGALILAAVVSVPKICAQTVNDVQLWEWAVGVKVADYPNYVGSKNSELLVLPLVEGYVVLGESMTFFSKDFNIGLDWQLTRPISAGLLLAGRPGRDSRDGKELAEMDNIDDTLEIGAYIAWNIHPTFSVDLAVLSDMDNTYEGWMAELTASLRQIAISDSLAVVTSATLTYGDAGFNDTYYGVDSNEVSANRPVYDVDAGVNQAKLSIELQYNPFINWRLTGSLDLYQLYGDVENSPIVDRKTQLIPTFSASYVF